VALTEWWIVSVDSMFNLLSLSGKLDIFIIQKLKGKKQGTKNN
jgi:hypothetical protein